MSFRATSVPERSSRGSGSCEWVSHRQAMPAPGGGGGVTHRVALLLGNLDDLGKRDVPALDLAKLVENITERARKDALDLFDFVARLQQVPERRQDGQPGADGGFPIDERPSSGRGVRRIDNVLCERQVTAESLLVGRDDVNVHLQDRRVERRNGIARRRINEDRRSLRVSTECAHHRRQIDGLATALELVGNLGDVKVRRRGLGVVQVLLGIGDHDEAEFARERRREELAHDGEADAAEADECDGGLFGWLGGHGGADDGWMWWLTRKRATWAKTRSSRRMPTRPEPTLARTRFRREMRGSEDYRRKAQKTPIMDAYALRLSARIQRTSQACIHMLHRELRLIQPATVPVPLRLPSASTDMGKNKKRSAPAASAHEKPAASDEPEMNGRAHEGEDANGVHETGDDVQGMTVDERQGEDHEPISQEAPPQDPVSAQTASILGDTEASTTHADPSADPSHAPDPTDDADPEDDADAASDAGSDSSASSSTRLARLEQDLERTRAEKDQLATQYRSLLSKLTAMRQSLGDRLREDAEELDRRESQVAQLTSELSQAREEATSVRAELENSANECAQLGAQVSALRHAATTQSSDVLSLTRELRELRGELEMVRVEREEWEVEAGRERERREAMEDELRNGERQRRDDELRRRRAEEAAERERTRADNLQEVLAEFQSAKDLEIQQATWELENQLKQAVQSLAEWKTRAADAEVRRQCLAGKIWLTPLQVKMTNISSDVSRTSVLEREIKEKNAQIGRLRHEGACPPSVFFPRPANLAYRSGPHPRTPHRSPPPPPPQYVRHQRRPPPRYQCAPPIHRDPTRRSETVRNAVIVGNDLVVGG